MKMKLKSILVGCVGGLIALTGPVSAKPVEYVKICSLYGAGFYYIPGTDMCIKVGGYVRAEGEYQSINGLSYGSTNGVNDPTKTNGGIWGPSTIDDGSFTRRTNSINFTPSGVISVDARNQSEYGTLRSYIRLGLQPNSSTGNAANSFFVDRAFIQFAGFTFGLTESFFDIYSNTETFSYTNAKTSGDTTRYGIATMAYTAQFGNGLSGTIGVEIPRYQAGVANGFSGTTTTGWQVNGATSQDQRGFNVPDIIGNLRVDQAWGTFGVSGALHQVAGKYYTGNSEISGHPDDKWGWAVQAGTIINLPWRDTVGASVVWSKGATGYATKAGSWQMYHGNSVGVGWLSDGLYDNSGLYPRSQIFLTNAFSFNAGYEHRWNMRWKTSVYGGYTKIWYDDDAKNLANQHLPTPPGGGLACGVPVEGAVWPPISLGNGPGNSCSPNFSFWQIGTRTQWNIDASTSVGLDVNYTRLNTAYKGTAPAGVTNIYPATTNHSAVTSVDDQGTWSAIFRVQRNFYP